MPYPVNGENVTDTFLKNNKNMMDAIWYGAIYQRTLYKAQKIEELDLSEEQQQATGYADSISEETVKDISRQFVKDHMPKTISFKDYVNAITNIQRANTRDAVENEIGYRQVLDSFPPDEPNRETKADFLFGESIESSAAKGYLEDLQGRVTDAFTKPLDGIFKGETHGGDRTKATVGEALDGLGFSDAEKDAFIKKYGYESADQTFYDHYLKEKPRAKDDSVPEVMRNAHTMFQSCLQMEAAAAAEKTIGEELSPFEQECVTAQIKRRQKTSQEYDREIEQIKPWIEEKGDKLVQDLQKVHCVADMQKLRLMTESGGSLSDIGPDAPIENVQEKLTQERPYISQIIQGKKNADELVQDYVRQGDEKIPGMERKSAEKFINEVRKGFRDDLFEKTSDDYPAKQFADIFAARILSDSVRNDRSSLDKSFSRNELNAMSQKLMDNVQFRDFINETYIGDDDEGNKKLNDTARRLYSSRTHGGFIEDEFKKYLLKRPAGELENSPELARFMPTARERIDELKKQVKNNPGDKDLQEAAAAEIIAIRNACKVERKTGYGLDNRIPPAPEGKRLEDEALKLRQDAECRKILRDEATRKDLLVHGHGGKMMVNVRAKYDAEVGAENRNPEASSVLKQNTIGGRIQELRAEAQALQQKIEGRHPRTRSEAMEKAKEVLGEYVALIDKARNGRSADAPWQYVDGMKKSAAQDASAQRMMKTPEQAAGMMGAIASGDVAAFQQKLSQGLDPAQNVREQKAPVVEQPVAEGPQGPQGPQGPTA